MCGGKELDLVFKGVPCKVLLKDKISDLEGKESTESGVRRASYRVCSIIFSTQLMLLLLITSLIIHIVINVYSIVIKVLL